MVLGYTYETQSSLATAHVRETLEPEGGVAKLLTIVLLVLLVLAHSLERGSAAERFMTEASLIIGLIVRVDVVVVLLSLVYSCHVSSCVDAQCLGKRTEAEHFEILNGKLGLSGIKVDKIEWSVGVLQSKRESRLRGWASLLREG